MKASLISVGNELLDGQTVDTNAAFLGRELVSLGLPVTSQFTAGDDIDRIARVLALACEDADVVLVTGGLGPTADDLTRQALARFLGVELRLSEDLLRQVKAFFDRRGVVMPEINAIQAHLPAGTEAIPNDLGTAPGVLARCRGRLIALMPGVPFEMRQMFGRSLVPILRQACAGQVVVVHRLRCFGEGESSLAERIGSIMERGRNPQVNCTVDGGVVTLHIVATAGDLDEARQRAARDVETLRARLGSLLFGTGDQTLAEVVGGQLARAGKTLAVAESCTGGLLAKMLTDVGGSSRYFTCGWVTYSNQAKIRELGVPADALDTYGAVSEQVALAMARGARREAGTDYAIGITGIAGPAGGTEEKPVGLVFIAVEDEEGARAERFQFSKDRHFIRQRAAQTALNMVRLRLGL